MFTSSIVNSLYFFLGLVGFFGVGGSIFFWHQLKKQLESERTSVNIKKKRRRAKKQK